MRIVAQVAPTFVVAPVVSPNVPEKTLFWQGYDMYVEAYFGNDPLTVGELLAMTPEEKRGYETAQRHQSDCETDLYLSNTNTFGDLTQY